MVLKVVLFYYVGLSKVFCYWDILVYLILGVGKIEVLFWCIKIVRW